MNKTMKFLKLMPVLFLLFAAKTNAQRGEVKLDINYSYALPMGSFKTDVISKGSPRGVTGNLLFGITNQFSAGLGLGFQDFYEKYPRNLYKTGDNETTSAVLSNSVQIIPLLAKAEFDPLGNKRGSIQPYITGGVGLGIISFTQYLGEFGGTDNSAGLMVQGGAGLKIPFTSIGNSGFKIGANYNMVNYNKNGFNNLNNLNFQAGVYFPLR